MFKGSLSKYTSFKESTFKGCQISGLNGALVCVMLVLLKGKGNSLDYFKKWINRIDFTFRRLIALQGKVFGFR